MYRTLYDLAGIAMLGWALLIFLPTWRVTRWIAERAVFPLFLAALYLVGVAAVVAESGFGFMSDFGSAEGVLGLLATESIALIAWIHILAFDQVVALLIYRDNMEHRFVPVPVQSLLLFLTLMLGPLGFLGYWAIRGVRGRTLIAWGTARSEAAPMTPRETVPGPAFAELVSGRPLEDVRTLLARVPAMVVLSLTAFAFAAVAAGLALVNGGWMWGAEGRLLEALKFDAALGIYLLTLGLLLPFAPWTARGRRRWIRWKAGLIVFSLGVENIQAWRGLDPRFSEIAGPVDQAIGGLFLIAAIGVMALFIVLLVSFARPGALPDHPGLRLALRYAAAGSLMGFGVGIAMSLIGGREVGAGGDLMLVHAAGFHALQAVPLVALLLGAEPVRRSLARLTVHSAGAGWLLINIGFTIQAIAGNPPLAPAPALGLAVAGAGIWATALLLALRERYAAPPLVASMDRG